MSEKKLERNMADEESRKFWDYVSAASKRVEAWPSWKRATFSPEEREKIRIERAKIDEDIKDQEKRKFLDHLKSASKRVEAWPSWKRATFSPREREKPND